MTVTLAIETAAGKRKARREIGAALNLVVEGLRALATSKPGDR